MSFPLESYLLHFWSSFPEPTMQEVCQNPEITQKADTVFTAATLQSGFIEDLKELEDTGFFDALAFLDDLEDPIEKKTVTEYTKQDAVINDFKENPKQIIANSCENGQNSNNSTKETLPRRSERIAEKRGFTENSSRFTEIPSLKKQRYAIEFKKEVIEKIGTMSAKELSGIYQIHYKTINNWVKLYSSLKTV